jgi:predicted alpha/beta-fold hydrolase
LSLPPYRAPFWLPGAHAQTIWPLAIKGRLPAYRRERWDTPDGDFIDVDWVGSQQSCDDTGLCVVLFHGLEGSSRSHYARSLMRHVEVRGWCGVVVHFRGCSGVPNRLPRAYHSGDSAEIDWVLRRLKQRTLQPLVAVGVSLGGNALLKWLGEQGTSASQVLVAAGAVGAPVDLAAANESLTRGFNRVYARHFLRTLIPAALDKDRRFPGLIDVQRTRKAATLRDFDDAVTAPLHGFKDAADYYARSSAKTFLADIAIPTLMLHAANDPFMPMAAFPETSSVSPMVQLEVSACGGHIGFVSEGLPGKLDWLPQRLLAHFEANASWDSCKNRVR